MARIDVTLLSTIANRISGSSHWQLTAASRMDVILVDNGKAVMSSSGLLPVMARPPLGGLHVIRLRWRVIALFGAIGIGAGLAFYLCMPKWYEAELLIVPKRPPSELGAASKLLGNLPIDLEGSSPFGQSDAERIAAILQSRTVTDTIITKFDLVNRYETDYIERARKAVWAHCTTLVERKPNTVRLTCEDKEPEVARDIANAFGQAGDAAFRRIALSSAREERAFLEKRLGESRHDLDESSEALRKFREAHKIIDLPEQGKAVVSAMAALEGDLISKRIELLYTRGFATEDEASVAQLRRRIEIVSGELASLENRPSTAPHTIQGRPGSEVFPPVMALPALGVELEMLMREHKIRETLFLMLTQRYEARKLDEARDLSSFVLADEAALPTFRARPTLRVLPVGMFAGFAIGILIVLLPTWWRELRRRAALEAQTGAV
ncbi:MAG TPA: hypothetical protein VFK02_30210 [Kofleriaceae bacterium]|nr:hypothetical protein [Kofleriaceae bacterium]